MRFAAVSVLVLPLALACSDGASPSSVDASAPHPDASSTAPTGAAALEAWLGTGVYKSWSCEPAVHASRTPSPHGFNRICSNATISQNIDGAALWPVGATAVKELYDSATDTAPSGYSVYVKQSDGAAGGANWYWYERIGADVIADGVGTGGPAKTICVGCHKAAGSDAAHTPTPKARDHVYTPVR